MLSRQLVERAACLTGRGAGRENARLAAITEGRHSATRVARRGTVKPDMSQLAIERSASTAHGPCSALDLPTKIASSPTCRCRVVRAAAARETFRMFLLSLRTAEIGPRAYRLTAVGPTLLLLVGLSAIAPLRAVSQADTSAADTGRASRVGHEPVLRAMELLGALGGAAALDRPMRSALMQRAPDGYLIHALSVTGNALGTANHLVPALAGAYVFTQMRGTPEGPPAEARGHAATRPARPASRGSSDRPRRG